IDGKCSQNLFLETAMREGLPIDIVERAKALYVSVYDGKLPCAGNPDKHDVPVTIKDAVTKVCEEYLVDLH
ncbi:hypothetical protein A2U01_0082094, partial [Trifolium medium]|nr:hypothetical protein [Trifolium medium]